MLPIHRRPSVANLTRVNPSHKNTRHDVQNQTFYQIIWINWGLITEACESLGSYWVFSQTIIIRYLRWLIIASLTINIKVELKRTVLMKNWTRLIAKGSNICLFLFAHLFPKKNYSLLYYLIQKWAEAKNRHRRQRRRHNIRKQTSTITLRALRLWKVGSKTQLRFRPEINSINCYSPTTYSSIRRCSLQKCSIRQKF